VKNLAKLKNNFSFVYNSIVQLQFNTGDVDKDGNSILKNANCLACGIYTDWGLMTLDGRVQTKAIYDKIEGVSKDLFSRDEQKV
jgi:hypothetical protein